MLIAHEISGKEHPIQFVIIGNGLGLCFSGCFLFLFFTAVITNTWLFVLGEMLHKKAGAALRGSMGSIWLCPWQAAVLVVAVPVPVMAVVAVPVPVMAVVVVTVTVRVVPARTIPAGAAPVTSPGQVPGRWAQRGERRRIVPSSARRGVRARCAGH